MTTTILKRDYRIYVACLSSYNNGDTHGAWIDCEDKTAEELQEEVNEMLASSKQDGAEEYSIYDMEGFPDTLVGENTAITEVAEIMQAIQEQEHEEAFIAMVNYSTTLTEAISRMEDYLGEHDSFEDFAEEWLESSGTMERIPEDLQKYFDLEAYTRDLEHTFTVLESDDWGRGCFVFSA